jgi:hypothetical protein
MKAPPPIPRPRRRSLWPIIVGVLVLLPILTTLTPYLYFRLSNSKAIHRLEAQAHQKGEPLTLKELTAKYPTIPDDQNAAIALLELWEKENPAFWQAYHNGEKKLPERKSVPVSPALPFLGSEARRLFRSVPLTAASREAAQAYLDDHSNHLHAVRLALNRPRCCFRVNLTNFADASLALLPYLPQMRSEAQNFRIAATLALDRGNTDEAISALEDIVHTGQALADGPLLIDQLVRVTVLGMSWEEAQRLLSQRSLSSAQLSRLESLFGQIEVPGAWSRGLIGEQACILHAFDHPTEFLTAFRTGSEEDSDAVGHGALRVGTGIFGATGLSAVDRRFAFEKLQAAISLAKEDSPEALRQYEKLFATIGREVRQFPPKIFSGLMLPTLSRAGAKFASFEARRRAALVAIAVERYRLTHQRRLPEKLEALVPDYPLQVPTDPYDGQPFRFHSLPAGFVVYSIGEDRRDDGGKERPEKGPLFENYDQTIIVER